MALLAFLWWLVSPLPRASIEAGICLAHTFQSDVIDPIAFANAHQIHSSWWTVAWPCVLVGALGLAAAAYAARRLLAISAKSNQWQQAPQLLQEMPVRRILPTTIAYNAAISACQQGHQWQAALQLLQEIPCRRSPHEIAS